MLCRQRITSNWAIWHRLNTSNRVQKKENQGGHNASPLRLEASDNFDSLGVGCALGFLFLVHDEDAQKLA
jgi:hypothetical protein